MAGCCAAATASGEALSTSPHTKTARQVTIVLLHAERLLEGEARRKIARERGQIVLVRGDVDALRIEILEQRVLETLDETTIKLERRIASLDFGDHLRLPFLVLQRLLDEVGAAPSDRPLRLMIKRQRQLRRDGKRRRLNRRLPAPLLLIR